MKLIINADDFGLSKSITDGIIDGIKNGYITSTTIMANMEYTEYAIKEAIDKNINCIGLHINLTAGKPILKNNNLTDEEGNFLYNQKQIDNTNLTYEDVYNEITAQINQIKKLSQNKIKLDHLDTHHFIFNNETIKQVIIDIAKEYKLPIRNQYECDIVKPDLLYIDFTMNNISTDEIEKMISKYKDTNDVIELITHSGYIDEYTKKITSYLDRDKELITLKEAKEKGIFNGIELIDFKELN